jgi:excisionase family DNA binding protein
METTYYTPEELAGFFKVSPSTIYKWISEGKLGSTKLGRRAVRVSKKHLDDFILERDKPATVSVQTAGVGH